MSELAELDKPGVDMLLVKIERELSNIDDELGTIDEIVEKDFNTLISKYISPDDSKASNRDMLQELKARHFKTLKEKKKRSLEKAKERLYRLRNNIQLTT